MSIVISYKISWPLTDEICGFYVSSSFSLGMFIPFLEKSDVAGYETPSLHLSLPGNWTTRAERLGQIDEIVNNERTNRMDVAQKNMCGFPQKNERLDSSREQDYER
jgi:hypothetical protein